MKKIVDLARNLLLVFLSFGFSLLLLEGIVRMLRLVPVNDYRLIFDASFPFQMKPHSSMVEEQPEFKVEIKINNAGFRDVDFTREKKKGRLRIAVVGDSFAFGTGVKQGERASDYLQADLRAAGLDCEVYNFGMPGMDTFGATEVLKRSITKYRPDYVLLLFYVGNDVADNYRTAQGSAAQKNPAASASARPSLKGRALQWVAGHSQLYRFVIMRAASSPALRKIYNNLKAANALGEVSHQLEILKEKNAKDAPLWAPTREALRKFTRTAAESKIKVVVALLPSRIQYDDQVWKKSVEAQHLAETDYSRSRPDDIIMGIVAETQHADALDALPAFARAGRGAGATYYPVNGHFTPKGQRRLADALTVFFKERRSSVSSEEQTSGTR